MCWLFGKSVLLVELLVLFCFLHFLPYFSLSVSSTYGYGTCTTAKRNHFIIWRAIYLTNRQVFVIHILCSSINCFGYCFHTINIIHSPLECRAASLFPPFSKYSSKNTRLIHNCVCCWLNFVHMFNGFTTTTVDDWLDHFKRCVYVIQISCSNEIYTYLYHVSTRLAAQASPAQDFICTDCCC